MCVWADGLKVHIVIDWETETVLHVTIHEEIAEQVAQEANDNFYHTCPEVTVVTRMLMPEDKAAVLG